MLWILEKSTRYLKLFFNRIFSIFQGGGSHGILWYTLVYFGIFHIFFWDFPYTKVYQNSSVIQSHDLHDKVIHGFCQSFIRRVIALVIFRSHHYLEAHASINSFTLYYITHSARLQ
eukprot:sb/3476591/